MTDATAAALADALRDRYLLERELGRGGMATVYLAHDLKHGRLVALKVLHPHLAATLGPERFQREIRFAARLQHPSILPLLDSGEVPAERGDAPTRLWYTMPYVEGESLRDRLRREGQQSIDDAIRWTVELAEALAYAHGQGIVHRDIKPENVLLSGTAARDRTTSGGSLPARAHALLADFGVARALEATGAGRLTETGLALGTPTYMSPEQAMGDAAVDGRSDLYSLGCLLYEMLVGEPPYTGPTAQAIVAKRLSDPVPSARRLRPTVPPGLDEAIRRLLAQVPADRFATAAELVTALEEARHPPPPSAAAGGPARRARAVAALAGVLIVGGVLLGIGIARLRRQSGVRLDPASVAVLPFRVTAPDRSLDYLGEGMVDLLAVKLAGPAGPRAVPPRQILSYLRYRPGMEISPEAASDVARRAGAGLVLDGSVVRSGQGVQLSAALRETGGSGRALQAAVTGELDSLPALVDRLAAELLAGHGGATRSLGSLSSSAAIGAYLQGKASHRRGRYREAVAYFEAALRVDSTFGLAALDLIASTVRASDNESFPRALRLAWAQRDRLGPEGRALLRAWIGPNYPEESSLIAGIAAWQDAVQAAPGVADAWFELGDRQLHWGALNDLDRPVEAAAANFRRALELDSSFVLPLEHLLLALLGQEDTTDLRELAAAWRAQDTVAGDWSDYMRWRLAIALGDSATVRAQRSRLDRWSEGSLKWLVGEAQAQAVGLGDVERGIQELERRTAAGGQRREARMARRTWLLNRGRPAAARALTDSLESGQPFPGWARLRRIDDALFWDGDTVAAAADVRALAAETATRPPPADSLARAIHVRGMCRLGLWSLSRGDRAGVRQRIGRLRAERLATDRIYSDDDRLLCAQVLEAWLAWREGRPDAGALLEGADSIYLYSLALDTDPASLVTARVREGLGDLVGARRAAGRTLIAVNLPPALHSTFLREQARLALQAGDTASAVRALRRYVALRSDPEPSLRPDLERARAELASLVGR